MPSPGNCTARVKLTIAKRAINCLKPAEKPWIAWDDRLTGYGVLAHPSVESYIVNYRLVIGYCDRMPAEHARREAHRLLGVLVMGEDPAAERARSRHMSSLGKAFEQ